MEDADFGLVDNLKFNGGSIVKLYSYEFPTGSKGDISTDLYEFKSVYAIYPFCVGMKPEIIINLRMYLK